MGPVKSKNKPTPQNNNLDLPCVYLAVLGDKGVGKTSLMMRFIKNTFTSEPLPPRGNDVECRTINMEGQEIDVWMELPPDMRFRTQSSTHFRRANGILVCFDVTNKQSWDNLSKRWLREIERYRRDDCLVIIVGCKADYLASPPPNTFRPFVPPNKKIQHDPNLPIWYQNSILCSFDFISHLFPFLTHTHLMKLRLVCKWLYNITIDTITKIQNKSQVTKEEVEEVCVNYNLVCENYEKNLDVFYTSSKFGVGIDEITKFCFTILAYQSSLSLL